MKRYKQLFVVLFLFSFLPTACAIHHLTNTISADQLSCTYFFKKHTPLSFALHVDGKLLESGNSYTTSHDNIQLTYTYAWKTPWGEKKGSGTQQFTLHTSTTPHLITFNGWKERPRLSVSAATPSDAEQKNKHVS